MSIATAQVVVAAGLCAMLALAIGPIRPVVAQARDMHKDRGLIETAPAPKAINYDN